MRNASYWGLRMMWDPEDRDSATAAHRAALDGSPASVFGAEKVARSVQELFDYGYSFTDIAVMFGVSREAVRQWFERYDLDRRSETGNTAMLRIWNDGLECFIPCTLDDYIDAALEARRERKRESIRQACRDIYNEQGRPPTLTEVAARAGYATNNPSGTLAHWFGRPTQDPGDTTFSEAMDRLYDEAGVPRERWWSRARHSGNWPGE